jgi:hypothetical protein
MSPITHFLTGWMVANLAKLDRKDRAIVTLACVVPDIDGLGIIPELLTPNSSHPLLWFTLYHHSLHTLAFALVVAVVSFVFARQRCRRVACSVEFSPSSVGGLGGTGWVSMAYSLSSAILFVAAAGVARTVGAEFVAERGDHRGIVCDHVVVGVAARVFTAGNGFHTGRCSPDNGSATTIPGAEGVG